MLSKTEAEALNRRIIREWAQDIGLEFYGVDLADVIAYDFLTLLGRAWLSSEGVLANE